MNVERPTGDRQTLVDDPVDKLAAALLYEGYILYPYRPDALKNRQRFNFGALYPPGHVSTQKFTADRDAMQVECLIQSASSSLAEVKLSVRVRCLHLQARDVFGRVEQASVSSSAVSSPADESQDQADIAFEPVPCLTVGERTYHAWQEALERDVVVADLSLKNLLEREYLQNFDFPAGVEHEDLVDVAGSIAGRIGRRLLAVSGSVRITAEEVSPGVVRVRVSVSNTTLLSSAAAQDRDELLLQTMISAHAVLQVEAGEFVSLLEPPAELQEAAAACQNLGVWPVLVGAPPRRNRMLASPIILYDYPQVAPESGGDWCDGAEIDEILALRVQTLAPAEKLAMRQIDDRARQMLERAESMTAEQMSRMHGRMGRVSSPTELSRPETAVADEFPLLFEASKVAHDKTRRFDAAVEQDPAASHDLQPGDRVLVQPRRRADVFDMALAGKVAIVEAVEHDFEGQVHVAVVIEDDPGRDLGWQRQIGHRFFFHADEVTRLTPRDQSQAGN